MRTLVTSYLLWFFQEYITSIVGFSSAHEMTHLIIIYARNTNILISIAVPDSLSIMGTIREMWHYIIGMKFPTLHSQAYITNMICRHEVLPVPTYIVCNITQTTFYPMEALNTSMDVCTYV